MSFDEIQFELGVGTQCGRCTDCACEIVAQCSVAAPVAAIGRRDFAEVRSQAGVVADANTR